MYYLEQGLWDSRMNKQLEKAKYKFDRIWTGQPRIIVKLLQGKKAVYGNQQIT